MARSGSSFRPRHGLSDTPVHRSWMSMRQRCSNPNDGAHKNYGGRGIKVCARWSSFENFIADMGPMPEGSELERIEVNGDYEPSNCRWATIIEQARNTRRTVRVEFNGKIKSLREWADDLDFKFHTLYRRIVLRHEDPATALSRPAARWRR